MCLHSERLRDVSWSMGYRVCDAELRKRMKGLGAGLASGSMAGQLDELPSEPKQSPFKRGLFIGLAIVIVFWLGFLILGAALLMFH